MTNFGESEKRVTPMTERNCHTRPAENYNRIYMAFQALYNSKTEYRDN